VPLLTLGTHVRPPKDGYNLHSKCSKCSRCIERRVHGRVRNFPSNNMQRGNTAVERGRLRFNPGDCTPGARTGLLTAVQVSPAVATTVTLTASPASPPLTARSNSTPKLDSLCAPSWQYGVHQPCSPHELSAEIQIENQALQVYTPGRRLLSGTLGSELRRKLYANTVAAAPARIASNASATASSPACGRTAPRRIIRISCFRIIASLCGRGQPQAIWTLRINVAGQ
jgi:hypothetical protein